MEINTSEACPTENWRISLGTRNNVLRTKIPYVPILVEDIPIHISFEDYKENGIKTIQTMGELVPKTEVYATLLSLKPGNKSEFPISFKHMSINDIYIRNPDNTRCAIWDKYTVFKVYGKLETAESETLLEVTHLVPVRDIRGTFNTMTLLSTIARSEYRWYYRTEGQNNMLQSQWDKMKEQKKRLLKVKTS